MKTSVELYEQLLEAYGKPRWWSDDPYKVMFQAILVQNTAWSSVEKVTKAVGGRLAPSYILELSQPELEALIRPCGFCQGKAASIRRLTEWYAQYSFDAETVSKKDKHELRQELLSLKGVGTETADVLLVFAFHLPSFIIDAYTRRFLERLGYTFLNDAEIRSFFENSLPRDYQVYGWFHWLVLDHGIQHCRKTPVCEGCTFYSSCQNSH